ncbi:MAG: hypothetical protein QXD98_04125 [Candidatus Diapherotrites archaeon]
MSKNVFIFLFLIFFSSIVLSCNTTLDCKENEFCIEGVCGKCDKENTGKLCSDDIINSYANDGVCTFDNKCEETSVCYDAAFNKIFSACALCENSSKCITDFQGKIEYDGICFNGNCFSDYCVSNSLGLISYCGSLSEACSIFNEEKQCDFVGDAEFRPENKRCHEEKCLEQKNELIEEKEIKLEKNSQIIKEEKKQLDVLSLIFGKLIDEPILFVSLFLLTFLAVIMFYNKSNEKLLEKAKITAQKRFTMFINGVFSSLLFFSIFQIANIFGYNFAYIISIILIFGLSITYFFKKAKLKERKILKV